MRLRFYHDLVHASTHQNAFLTAAPISIQHRAAAHDACRQRATRSETERLFACAVFGDCVPTTLSTSGENLGFVTEAQRGSESPANFSLRPARLSGLPAGAVCCRVYSAPFLPRARCILDRAKVLRCLGHDAALRTAVVHSSSGFGTWLLIREAPRARSPALVLIDLPHFVRCVRRPEARMDP
ncbi:hypothetical protein MTO96_031244 [Rhipicephalus appendiculatus]